jgi:hypothetical protein
MPIECYKSDCRFHSSNWGEEGPFCNESDCRMVGEVLEKDGTHFFVEFRGKKYSYFSSRIGAQTYLDMLRDNLER